MGTTALTVGDLKLLQNAIDLELIRLQNLRSVSALVTIKISQLQVLADNLADVKGRVDRGEINVESVAIFPATARQFLKTFRTSENIPELFDENGNSPASTAPAPTTFPGPSSAASTVPSSGAAPSSAATGPDFLQWFYENIQRLKWSLDADYHVEQVKQKEMSQSLNNMEKRILGYSYTDTPMPEGYQKMFLQRIRGLQKELNELPE
jgi:translation elongation factor EF-Tu-like GTPase